MNNKNIKKEKKISPIFQKLKIISNSFKIVNLKDTLNFSNLNSISDIALPDELISSTSSEQSSEFSTEETISLPTKNSSMSLISTPLLGYAKLQELKLVKIGLASSQRIIEWAEKRLPNGKIFGEVLNANTLHYKTFKPQKGGLFCERIFGPLKDFECACGIKQKPLSKQGNLQELLIEKKPKRNFCPNCDVEYTWSVIRRYQLGYIKLISPVAHLWYLRTNPSYLSLLLDIRKRDLESIIYCIQITSLEYYWRPLHFLQLNLSASSLFNSYKKYLNLLPNAKNSLKTKAQLSFLEKTKKKKLEERKAFYVRRHAIYSTSNTAELPPITLPENRSLEEQIQFLENSFRLSSADSYTETLWKSSKITAFLKQKISKIVKKKSFLIIHDKITTNFYKKSYNIVAKRNFLTLTKFSQFSYFYLNKNQTYLNFSDFSNLQINKKPYLINLSAKNYADSKSKFQVFENQKFNFLHQSYFYLNYILKTSLQTSSKERIKNQLFLNFLVFKNENFPAWRNSCCYTYVHSNSFNNEKKASYFTSQVNFLKVKTSTSQNKRTKNLTPKPLFLKNFINLIRKSGVQEPWTSISITKKEVCKFLSSFRTGKMPVNLKINSNSFSLKLLLKNVLFLYMLIVIQENCDSFIKRNSISFNNELLLNKAIQKFNLKKLLLSSVTKIENTTQDLTEIEFEFLSKFLQTNFLLDTNHNKLQFIEIEEIFQNPKNIFMKFCTLTFFKMLKIFIKFSHFKNTENCWKKTQKEFRIFLTRKNLEAKFWNSVEFQKLSISRKKISLPIHEFKDVQKNKRVLVEQLVNDRKIFQFLKNIDNYPTNSLLYFKNNINMCKTLSFFKPRKTNQISNIFNNLYTVSYSKGWETEKDWKYFLYYTTAPIEIVDYQIFNYRYRFLSNSSFDNRFFKTIPILGANFIQKLLFQYEGFELKKMSKQTQNVLPKLNRYIRYRKQVAQKKVDFLQIQKLLQKRDQLIRRLKLLRKLFKKNVKTTSMILNTLPVLPPDLRPILKMQNQIAASDLNRFYQRILYRNDRLKKFIRDNSAMMNYEPGFEMKYAQRLLQEAVDNLIQNGKGNVKPETNSRGQPLKSLSEILKGKQGRFRQYLLGKRVDYSGRSVIVVGPTLKIYECGLPFEMAMELFLPFLMKRLFSYNLAKTVIGAKTILKTQRKITWNLLEEVMENHPILLNRAPTLHRLGIQAFRPKLIEGRTILLHPLVCAAFNADFDGDQMAVHVPITAEARTEAWKLMFSRNHLISPATGDPMLLPSQDMVLGCYYLTTESHQFAKLHSNRPFLSGTQFYFSNMKQVLQAYLQERIHLQTPIWLKWNGFLQMDQPFSKPLEMRLDENGFWLELHSKFQKRWKFDGVCFNLFVRTTAGRIIFNTMIETCIQTKNF